LQTYSITVNRPWLLPSTYSADSVIWVDGGRGEVLLLEKEPVAEDDSSIEGQSRFGTIPTDELVDGMTV